LESAKKTVTEYLTDTVKFSEKERQFLKKFEAGFYHPELLFDDDDIINKLKKHPMALWKTAKARRAQEI
jgi:capsule polysaccharide modification protein KpsS